MSIAVSAIVRPSLRVRALQAGLAVGVIAVALACAGGALPLAWPRACAALGLLAGGAGLFALAPGRAGAKVYRIDISRVGLCRLAVYQQMALADAAARRARLEADSSAVEQVVGHRILADSTFWPGVLSLQLGDGNAQVVAVVVLPDSVAPGVFRPLSVACRAMAAHSVEKIF